MHTAAVGVAIALIPLVPLALWLYARAASVDRGTAVARNTHVFRSMPQLPGARLIAAYSYPVHRWDVGESLTPIVSYRTEFFLRLPRKLPRTTIDARYEQVLRGWREQRTDYGVSFTRAGVLVEIDMSGSREAKLVKTYGVYVSQ